MAIDADKANALEFARITVTVETDPVYAEQAPAYSFSRRELDRAALRPA